MRWHSRPDDYRYYIHRGSELVLELTDADGLGGTGYSPALSQFHPLNGEISATPPCRRSPTCAYAVRCKHNGYQHFHSPTLPDPFRNTAHTVQNPATTILHPSTLPENPPNCPILVLTCTAEYIYLCTHGTCMLVTPGL